jgi:hypothetical protein
LHQHRLLPLPQGHPPFRFTTLSFFTISISISIYFEN